MKNAKNAMIKKKSALLFLLSFLLILSFFSASASAKAGHMTLLAVTETENGLIGGTADLYLEIKPGSGRVFLETFPFTKVDTQMSTRYAQKIACEYVDEDCSRYDFFYTLRAKSSIIAGPSAGSAIAALTAIMLKDLPYHDDVAVTGTINSGGLIGPVGGLTEKVEAGSRSGLKRILIPKGESIFSNQTQREALEELMNGTETEVREISTLDDAIFYLSGERVKVKKEIEISGDYSKTMRELAQKLCQRTQVLKEESGAIDEKYSNEKKNGNEKIRTNEEENEAENASTIVGDRELAINLSQKGETALDAGAFYSSASYCFGSNVEYSKIILKNKGMDKEDLLNYLDSLSEEIKILRRNVENSKIETITDLESYMVTIERLSESDEFIENGKKNLTSTDQIISNAAWAAERLSSARSWFEFFGKPGKKYSIDESTLSSACAQKIAEADERIQYVELFLPIPMESARKDADHAREENELGNFELCIFKAAKAKASVGVVLGVFGVEEYDYRGVLEVKLDIVKEQIARQSEEGIFPILGYSYYEYASSLKESDPLSSLLYAEYALELGNLESYFENEKRNWSFSIDKKYFLVFLLGIAVGVCATILIRRAQRVDIEVSGARKWRR